MARGVSRFRTNGTPAPGIVSGEGALMDASKYASSAQVTRVCLILRVLAGHTVNGLSNGEIAKAIQDSPSNVTQTVAKLVQQGMVDAAAVEGRFRLGPALVQVAVQHQAEMEHAQRTLNEIKQRYSRIPR
jgi:DNA-binding IclR family transcriptional regulator